MRTKNRPKAISVVALATTLVIHELAKAFSIPNAGHDVFRDLDCLEAKMAISFTTVEKLSSMLLGEA
jgi:hypothetical protein